MSYSVDVNVLLYATDRSSPYYRRAREFVTGRASDPDIFCIAWITVMSFFADLDAFEGLRRPTDAARGSTKRGGATLAAALSHD